MIWGMTLGTLLFGKGCCRRQVERDTDVSRGEQGLDGNLMVFVLHGCDGYAVGTSGVVELILNYQEAKTDVWVLCVEELGVWGEYHLL